MARLAREMLFVHGNRAEPALPEMTAASSTRAHLRGKDDGITALAPIRDRFPRFADLLAAEPEADLFVRLRAAETIGRPLGDDRFLARIERRTGRLLKPGKRGPKPSAPESS